ncbi:MAG: hypothetical protein ACFFDI_04270 [Promethearchaeota archaeon]
MEANNTEEKSLASVEEEDLLQQAKKFLILADLVDRYPGVIERRVIGLYYILMAGALSISIVTFLSLFNTLLDFDANLLFIVIISGSLLVAFSVAVGLINSLGKVYRPSEPIKLRSKVLFLVFWVIISLIFVISFIIGIIGNFSLVFPVTVQLLLAIIMIGNYLNDVRSRNQSLRAGREHLFFGLVAAASIIGIFVFPAYSYTIMVLVDLSGFYLLGIYILISAEKFLLEMTGRKN